MCSSAVQYFRIGIAQATLSCMIMHLPTARTSRNQIGYANLRGRLPIRGVHLQTLYRLCTITSHHSVITDTFYPCQSQSLRRPAFLADKFANLLNLVSAERHKYSLQHDWSVRKTDDDAYGTSIGLSKKLRLSRRRYAA
jgi:hypothetical protein